jgi:competence protein ComGC
MKIKIQIISALIFAILGSSALTAIPAYAATNNTGGGNFFSGLVQYISKTFNLDQSKVQTAVNTYNTQQKANVAQKRQDNEQTRLDKLVTDGKITKDQETAIIAELAVLKGKYNPANFKSLTADQRKTQMQNEKADITAWSKSTGIDAKYLMPGFGGMGFRGAHKGFWKPTTTPTPSS